MLVNRNLIRKNTERLNSFFKKNSKGGSNLGKGFGGGWSQKELSPALSFMILGIVLLSVFIMGAYFMKEYIKAWDIASEERNYDLETLINESQQVQIDQELEEHPSI